MSDRTGTCSVWRKATHRRSVTDRRIEQKREFDLRGHQRRGYCTEKNVKVPVQFLIQSRDQLLTGKQWSRPDLLNWSASLVSHSYWSDRVTESESGSGPLDVFTGELSLSDSGNVIPDFATLYRTSRRYLGLRNLSHRCHCNIPRASFTPISSDIKDMLHVVAVCTRCCW